MACASFSMLDGPGGTDRNVPVRSCWDSRYVIVAAVIKDLKASTKNSSKLNNFLYGEVNQIIQYKIFKLAFLNMVFKCKITDICLGIRYWIDLRLSTAFEITSSNTREF